MTKSKKTNKKTDTKEGRRRANAIKMNSGDNVRTTTDAEVPVTGLAGVCSPANTHSKETVEGTCLTPRDVRDIAKWYNNTENGRAAPVEITPSSSTASLLDALHSRLGTRRGEEFLWTCVAPPASPAGQRLATAFRPLMPKSWIANDRSWLSNFDIQAVMVQYEEAVPDFWMVGVFPIDFALVLEDGQCVSMEMCGLSVAKMRAAGKTQAGIILNLDTHDQSGSHWVAVYVNIDPAHKNYGLFYYDSVSALPPPEINDFAESLRSQVVATSHEKKASLRKKPFNYEYNVHRRQFKNTECGVFAMFFLVCCMSRKLDFDYICRCMGNDENLHTLRAVFFRKPRT
jgi:hypothetical protein